LNVLVPKDETSNLPQFETKIRQKLVGNTPWNHLSAVDIPIGFICNFTKAYAFHQVISSLIGLISKQRVLTTLSNNSSNAKDFGLFIGLFSAIGRLCTIIFRDFLGIPKESSVSTFYFHNLFFFLY
jgi:hypothetical protein